MRHTELDIAEAIAPARSGNAAVIQSKKTEHRKQHAIKLFDAGYSLGEIAESIFGSFISENEISKLQAIENLEANDACPSALAKKSEVAILKRKQLIEWVALAVGVE